MAKNQDTSEPGDAAQAFEDLRAEVSVLRRAVEALPDEWAEHQPPDYTPSLGKITQGLADMRTRLEALERQPALTMTPERYRQEIALAGKNLIGDTVDRLRAAARASEETKHELAGMIGVARSQDEQFKWVLYTGLAAFVVGFVLSPLLSGWLPFGLDTRVAATILHADRWTAGAAMMEAENEAGWRALQDAAGLANTNAAAIAACREAAAKQKKDQACSIVVSATH